MTNFTQNLTRIIQFGTIKIVPGLFNLALIPYLVFALGAADYGNYSLLLSYALLVATVLGAIATQPMYRFLSSHPDELELFNSFAFVAAAFASGVTFLVVLLTTGNWLYSTGFSIFGAGAVVFSAISVRFQIAGQIGRLAAFETLRILTFLAALAVQVLILPDLGVGNVILAISISYVIPLALLARRLRPARPGMDWVKRSAVFGAKSAIWLLLAGLPIVGGKAFLSQAIPAAEFGYYAAVADVAYRGFGILNAAIVMWVFPLLSRAYDQAAYARVRRLLGFAVGTYGVAGLLGVIIAVAAANFTTVWAAPFSSGILAVAAIMVSCFLWQGMSLVQKPFELTLQTSRMVLFMLAALILFAVLLSGLTSLGTLDPILVLCLSLGVAALFYGTTALSVRLERRVQ